tara:strand:- start:49 stop:324 length:276 start_codon:yes stop_codon:yes gene_type:complete
MVKNIQKNLTNIVIIIGLISSIGVGFSKFGKLELTIEQLSTATAPDLSGIENNGFAILDNETEIKILNKELELIKLQLKEFKAQSSNPLGG